MPKRSYGQYCALARALDLVGDRWTLLIVRELLTGPKRFKELLAALPGIGPNLLTTRLRDMEENGLLQRAVLPPPAASAVYELTERGRGLDRVTVELARWGIPEVGPWNGTDHFNPEWGALVLRIVFRPSAAQGVRESYEFNLEGTLFHADIDDGKLEAALGPASTPAVRLTLDTPTFFELLRGLDTTDAIAQGRLRVEGNAEAYQRCLRLFTPGG